MQLSPIHYSGTDERPNLIDLREFWMDRYFSSDSGRALIIQAEADFLVFYLSPDIFNSPEKINGEKINFRMFVKAIFDDYTINEENNLRGICVLQQSFDSVLIHDDRIQLNRDGTYTEDPETIRNAAGEVVYRGWIIEGAEYQKIKKVCTGELVVSKHKTTLQTMAALDELIVSRQDTGLSPPDTPNSYEWKNESTLHANSIFRITALLLSLGLMAVVVIAFYQQSRLNELTEQIADLNLPTQSQGEGASPADKNFSDTHPDASDKAARPEKYYGIDIYHLKGDLVKFIRQKDSLHFVYCKATEGLTFRDDRYADNVVLVNGRNLLTGAYHFYRADDDPLRQANFFWQTIKNEQLPVLPLALDLEKTSFPGNKPENFPNFQSEVLTLLKELNRLSGKRPILYTNYNFAQQYLTLEELAGYPLWLADYETKNSPPIPDLWKGKGILIWQQSDTYLLHHEKTDLDVYSGSLRNLLQL